MPPEQGTPTPVAGIGIRRRAKLDVVDLAAAAAREPAHEPSCEDIFGRVKPENGITAVDTFPHITEEVFGLFSARDPGGKNAVPQLELRTDPVAVDSHHDGRRSRGPALENGAQEFPFLWRTV